MKLLMRLFKDEEGQGMVEYALIIALIAVALIVALILLKDKIAGIFSSAGDALTETTT